MSVNSTLHRNFVPELDALVEMVKTGLVSWRKVFTLEDRLLVEYNLIKQFEEILSLTYKLDAITSLEHPDFYKLNAERRIVLDTLKMNNVRLRSVIKMYIEYFNSQQRALLELIGALRRTKQKIATLHLWDRSLSKWMIVENFLNLDNVDTQYTTITETNVNTGGGFVTLPIKETSTHKIAKCRISKGSNGLPGNSELREVQTENRLPQFVFDDSNETWFEYERMDQGPLILNLTFFLTKEDILNGLVIQAKNLGNSINYRVANITFNSTDRKTKSIRELIAPEVSDDFFVVKTIGTEIFWEIAFMPVKARSITIKFIQENSYTVQSFSRDNRLYDRPRYAVAIQKVEFLKHKYDVKGGINSRKYIIPQGMYGAASGVTIYPRNLNLFDCKLNVSIDGGENWQNDVLGLPDVEGQTILCTGETFPLIWTLALERFDKAFKDSISFNDEEPRVELDSLLRTVSRDHSPINFQLKKKPFNKEVCVIEPNLARKSSDIRSSKRLGLLGSDDRKRLELPFSLHELDIDPNDLRIFCNNLEWTRSLTNIEGDPSGQDNVLGWMTYYISHNQRYVEFAPGTPEPVGEGETNEIRYLFREESLLFEQRSDGYYTKLKCLFDPDKENIKLKRFPSNFTRKTITLRQGVHMVKLGASYIRSFEHKDSSAVRKLLRVSYEAYSEFTITGNFDDNPADIGDSIPYYLDSLNGVLHLAEPLSAPIQVSFEYFQPSLVKSEHYDIWLDGAKPIGLVLHPEAMITQEVTENLNSVPVNLIPVGGVQTNIAPQAVMDVETGEYSKRADLFSFSEQAYTLTHKNIVGGSVILDSLIFARQDWPAPVEDLYVDGHTEFMGLTAMENDYTPTIQADSTGFVSFRLAAGHSLYRPFGIIFSKDGASVSNLLQDTEFPPFSNSRFMLNTHETFKAEWDASWGLGLYRLGTNADGSPSQGGDINPHAPWALDEDGLITVYVGPNGLLPGGIQITYMYIDPTFDSKNRYSVDYENGILYLSEPLDVREYHSVSYKTTSYSVSYDIAKEINSYKYNVKSNSVEVRTENLTSLNNKIKILWGKPPDEKSLEELKDYFSPIIYRVGVRFQ